MFWLKTQYRGSVSICFPLLICLVYNTQNASTIIAPSQLVTIIAHLTPSLKMGTDSRLGLGFRLSDNADFQMLVELGPQRDTRSIDDATKRVQSFNRRQVNLDDSKEARIMMTSTELKVPRWVNGKRRTLQNEPTSVQQLELLYKLAATSSSLSPTSTTT